MIELTDPQFIILLAITVVFGVALGYVLRGGNSNSGDVDAVVKRIKKSIEEEMDDMIENIQYSKEYLVGQAVDEILNEQFKDTKTLPDTTDV